MIENLPLLQKQVQLEETTLILALVEIEVCLSLARRAANIVSIKTLATTKIAYEHTVELRCGEGDLKLLASD